MHEGMPDSMKADKQSMRVVMIAHVFGFNDGQGRVNFETAMAAANSGMQVTMIAEKCADQIVAHPNIKFVRIAESRLPVRLLKNISFAFRSSRWIRRNRERFDLIQANGFVTFSAVDIVTCHFVHSAWDKRPRPSSSLAPHLLYQRIYTKINSALEKMLFRKARRVVAISESVAKELVSVGVSPGKITTIPNGVDVEQFSPRPAERAAFHLPQDKVLFLFAGDIRTNRKNLDTVLRAAVNVLDLHLVVAGSTAGSPFPAEAHSLGISDRVQFLGKVSRMNDLMAACDVFVFPSRYDPFGLVILEAMASGLPVITAKTTGAYAVLNDPERTLSDPEDVTHLSQLMTSLRGNRELREMLGKRNRTLSLGFSWQAMADRYLELYRQLHGSSI